MQGRHRGNARSSFSARAPFVALMGARAPHLGFTGSLTVEKGSAGPHFTLVVNNNPATNPYNGFTETTDADGVSTLATADVTISGAVGAHTLVYTATSSGGRPDLTLTVTVTIADTVAPVLTLPTDVSTGATTGNIGATTDSADGTMHVVASTSITAPTAAQIIAGQMHTGSAAAASANAAVASSGAKAIGVTGLTTSTTYYGHAVHRDAAGNSSNVVSGDGFVPASAFSPADLAPDMWLDPSDLTTLFQNSNGTGAVSADGDPVGKIVDKGDGALDPIQATAGSRPLYKTTGGVGTYLKCDGVDDRLVGGAWTNAIAVNHFDLLVAFRVNAITTAESLGGAPYDNDAVIGGSNGRVAISFKSAGPTAQGWWYDGSNFDGQQDSMALNTAYVATLRYDGTTLSFQLNNSTAVTVARGNIDATLSAGNVGLGNQPVSGNFCECEIYGVFAKKTQLSGVDLASLKTWLGAKVGLTL